MFVFDFVLILFRIIWWPSAEKELSPWLSAPVVFILCCLNRMCSVPVRTTGVWCRLWNSIVPVPDHCHFIYVSFKLSIRQSITQNDWQFDKQKRIQTGEKKFTLTFMGWASNLHLWFSAWMFATRGWTWFDPRRMHIFRFVFIVKVQYMHMF